MKKLSHLVFLLFAMPALVLLTGCEEPPPEPVQEESMEWDPSWGPMPEGYGATDGMENGEAEIIQDTAYIVMEKRQAGGQLIASGEVSKFDGKPRKTRTPLESMIIVQGDMTGQRSAYLLPETDYNVVRIGNRLQQSTLNRWESTTENHIPPPPSPDEDDPQRSRTGGAAEQFVY